MNKDKKILYFDMDNTLVDFPSAFKHLSPETIEEYGGLGLDSRIDEVEGIFSLMEPISGAVEAFQELSEIFDVYILSTAPWRNPSAWQSKLLWVQKNLGEKAHKRLILSHNKHLNHGDFLVDDRPNANGADRFRGEVVPFGLEEHCKDWKSTVEYLKTKA